MRVGHTMFSYTFIIQGVKYQLFYRNTPREDVTSSGTSLLQSYGKAVLETDTVEAAREKVEAEIRRLPTATWQWENQSEANLLGDLRVFQKLPGKFVFLDMQLEGRALTVIQRQGNMNKQAILPSSTT